MLIARPDYLGKLKAFKDKHLIKIITGVRRCGKSTMFVLFQEYLKSLGVDDKQIQNINLEDANNEHFKDWKILHDHIQSLLIPSKKNYIFLDEIQNVPDFQKAVDSLFIKDNVDLYLTGSNAHLQSGEWATLLSGRFVKIQMFPLSFKEYINAYADKDKTQNQPAKTLDEQYETYITQSSFPQVFNFSFGHYDFETENVKVFLDGIYSSIVKKDIENRLNIRGQSRLDRIVKFLFSNIGSETSIKNIADYISSNLQTKTDSRTIEPYIDALLDSFIMYKATRYYIKGKEFLKTNAKYYFVDMGLRHFLLGSPIGEDRGHILENIVYLELLRQGYDVYYGKVNNLGVDFVAVKNGEPAYFQIAQSVLDSETLARELTSLEAIDDNYPKFLLTRDYETVSHNGIKQLNVLKWLLA
jgi:predicted AAA+ superfamily ATPase